LLDPILVEKFCSQISFIFQEKLQQQQPTTVTIAAAIQTHEELRAGSLVLTLVHLLGPTVSMVSTGSLHW